MKPRRLILAVMSLLALSALIVITAASITPGGGHDRVVLAVDRSRLARETPVHDSANRIWLVVASDDTPTAWLDADAFSGCPLQLAPARQMTSTGSDDALGFVEPIWRSIYDLDGVRLFGPAPRGLTEISVGLVADRINVHADDLARYDGVRHDPSPEVVSAAAGTRTLIYP